MIRSILAPTDFSPNSLKALDYAVYLANELEAELHLVHTYETPGSTGGHFIDISGVIREEREEELAEALKQVAAKMRHADKLHGHIREQDAVAGIDELSQEVKADLIVMGTQGATGLRKVLMGSTTASLIEKTRVPVLAVPYEVAGYALHNVVIALDEGKMPDTFILNTAVGLGRHFKAVFKLVHISEQLDKETQIDPAVASFFKQFEVAYTYHRIQTEDVEAGLLGFAREQNANLLCVITHHKSWLERLFFGSISKQLAMNSSTPLLVLHGK